MKKLNKEVFISIVAVLIVISSFIAVSGYAADGDNGPTGFVRKVLSTIFVGDGEKTENAANADTRTGVSTIADKSKEEIIAEYRKIATPYSGNSYKTVPSCKKPYSNGTLEPAYNQDSLSYINYIRYLAKLPSCVMSEDKMNRAQSGAVLMAADDIFAHTLPKPADMPQSFYDVASQATNGSNIGVSYDYPSGYPAMRKFIDSCMYETHNEDTLAYIAHRRWFIWPSLYDIGFGQAESEETNIYDVIYIQDDQNDNINFDTVAWPPSGYFPDNMIDSSVPWCITFNDLKYGFSDDYSEISVRVTRKSDNRVFELTTADNQISTEKSFLVVDEHLHGTPLCIVFNLGSENQPSSVLSGDYEVEVDGVRKLAGFDYDRQRWILGDETTFCYTTSFFSIDNPYPSTSGQETDLSESVTYPSDVTETADPSTEPTATVTTSSTTTTTTKPTTTTTTTKPTTTTTTKPTTTAPAKAVSMSVASRPSKTEYIYKSNLETSGLSLKVAYSNGEIKTVKSGFSCSPTYLNRKGTQNISVSYEGLTTSFSVTVKYSVFQYLILIFLLGFLWY